MIQRGLLRQLRTASVRSYCPHTSWKSGSLRLPTQLSSLQQRIAPRCYSTTPETQESKPSDPPVSEKLKPEAVNESSLQRDLEAKSREIIDLKVRPPAGPQPKVPILTLRRTNISAASPNSATSKKGPNVISTPPAPSPSRASPPTSSKASTISTAPSAQYPQKNSHNPTITKNSLIFMRG